MKILHIIPGLQVASGPTAFCVNVANCLADTDLDVSIACKHDINPGEGLQVNPKIEIFIGDKDPDFLSSFQIAHIHALWHPYVHQYIRLLKKYKIPYVMSTHGMLAPWALKHKWLKKKIAWMLYQKRDLLESSVVHVTAESEIAWLRNLGFAQPCTIAPLGCELPEINKDKFSGKSASSSKSVLFVGRIYPVKGLMNLIRAWAKLKKIYGSQENDSLLTVNRNPWQLFLAGPDQAGHKAELTDEAVKLGLKVGDASVDSLTGEDPNTVKDDVVFTGAVYSEDKEMLYQNADLFVLPSFTENFGVVVIDALSYGVPVITTKGTPWSDLETYEKGSCGWWVDIGADPLVEALSQAMKLDDGERLNMGLTGREMVSEKYSWSKISGNLNETYKWVLEGGGSPACMRSI